MKDGLRGRLNEATQGGAIALLLSKAWFFLAGWCVYAALSRLLSSEDYGRWGLVIGLLSTLNASLIGTAVQTTGRFVAAHPGSRGLMTRRVMQVMLALAALVCLVLLLGAERLAAGFHDPLLTTPFRICSLLFLPYVAYACLVGRANGEGRFVLQGSLEASNASAKLLLICLATVWGASLNAALGGFLAAACLMAILAFVVLPARGISLFGASEESSAPDGPPSTGRMTDFIAVHMSFLVTANLMAFLDLFCLKRFSAPAAPSLLPIYVAAQTFGRMTWQGATAVISAGLPLVVASAAHEGREACVGPLRKVSLLVSTVLLGSVAVLAGEARGCLSIVFPPSFAGAAPLMTALVGASFFLGLHLCFATLLSALGRSRQALLVNLGALGILALLARAWIPRFGPWGAIAAAALSWSLAALVSASALAQRVGWPLPAKGFLLRVSWAMAIALGLRILTPSTWWAQLLEILGFAALYGLGAWRWGWIGSAPSNELGQTLEVVRLGKHVEEA